MKRYIFFLVSILSLPFLFSTCKQKDDTNDVILKVKVEKSKKKSIGIYASNALSATIDTLCLSTSDSMGNAILKFKLNEPKYAYLEVDDKTVQLYLSPETDLQLSFIPDKLPLFEGKGAEANNYLVKSNQIVDNFEMKGGKYFFQLDSTDFINRIDSLQTALANFHKSYLDSVAIPKQVAVVLENRNNLKILFRVMNYGAMLASNNVKIPDKLEKIINNVVKSDKYLEAPVGTEYSYIMDMYLQVKYEFPLFRNNTKYYIYNSDKLSTATDSAIRKSAIPERVREFLLALNIHKNLASNGVTTSLDSLAFIFKNAYPHSDYLSSLSKARSSWHYLSKGKDAPNFEGLTLDNKKISLHNLKGKVVYVDVWATWCGPCIEEIPYSQKVSKSFKDNDDVVFLYVSIDNNSKSWKKYLQKNKNFSGLHINMTEPNSDSFIEAYKMRGIPQFMLIDKAGKIVSVKAPRPSSGKLENEIRKILEHN